MQRAISLGLAAAIGAVLSGGVTYASTARSGTITACANRSSGALRLAAKGKCLKSERKVTWNQTGPQGTPGINGANGANGVNGINGTNGATQVVKRSGTPATVPKTGGYGHVIVSCVGTERVVGGGEQLAAGVASVTDSAPYSASAGAAPTGWFAQARNDNATTDDTINAYVLCASP